MANNMVHLPEELMARVHEAAATEKLSPDELVRGVVEAHLRRKRLDALYAYGEAQARKLGIKEDDVDAIVEEERDRVKLGL